MQNYDSLNKNELEVRLDSLCKKYNDIKDLNLNLNLTRGKPEAGQLDLTLDMLKETDFVSKDGTDCRNYGILDGIPEMKEIFAKLLSVDTDEVFVGGNSSLQLMHDIIANYMLLGTEGGTMPWCKQEEIKFLCPVPGYDRHFLICEKFGIKMIPIPMNSDGPDMDKVEALVNNDSSVKGIWCVPKYSNPSGITYSDDTVRRFAALKPVAKDFRIFWDNAYCIHDFGENQDKLLNIFDECKKYGSEDNVIEFISTSKITFAGAGVAAFAASRKNIKYLSKQISIQTIGFDKLNQLRHVAYFKNADGVLQHMKKHADIMAPKFKVVLDTLHTQLEQKGIGEWTKPNGGYFVSFNLKGCAKRIVSLAQNAGVQLTPAGATYPYGFDENDSNIRIAPTFATVEELKTATEIFCLCAEIAYIEKRLME